MNSFNVYGQTTETIGGSTPIWLGTVKPIPVGAKLDDFVGGYIDGVIPGGKLVHYDANSKECSILQLDEIERANGYLYNDIYADDPNNSSATCAVVMHHPEGLLIERVYPEITEEQIAALQAKIPGVLLVRG